MNYQRWSAATKEQLLQCIDNLIKILYFHQCALAFQKETLLRKFSPACVVL